MGRRQRLTGILLGAALATAACGAAPTAGTPTAATTSSTQTRLGEDLSAQDVGPAVQHAVADVVSVRTTGTISFEATVAPIEIETLYEDSFVTAREAYYGDDGGGATGYLGVDGDLYDRSLTRSNDREAVPWRLLNADVDSEDLFAAASIVNLDGRMEVVSYLLGARDAELTGIEQEGGTATVHYSANAPVDTVIEYSVPGEVEFWEHARDEGGIKSWDLDVWLPADLRPVKMRLAALDEAGTQLSVVEETYVYDSPDDDIIAPNPTAVTTAGS